MKTSVIEVRDMLSVLSVDGVEKRIGEVPGVESVTLNFAAKSATVRYDETRLEVGDIKSDVRQRGYESAPEPPPEPASHDKPASAASEQATPQAPLKVTSPPVAEAPKADPVAAPEAAAAAPAAVPPPTPPTPPGSRRRRRFSPAGCDREGDSVGAGHLCRRRHGSGEIGHVVIQRRGRSAESGCARARCAGNVRSRSRWSRGSAGPYEVR